VTLTWHLRSATPFLLKLASFLRQAKIVYLSFPTLPTSYRFATVPPTPRLNSAGGLEAGRRETQEFVSAEPRFLPSSPVRFLKS
jgi:hypothetical protein